MVLVDGGEHAKELDADDRRRVRQTLHQLWDELGVPKRLVDARAGGEDLLERVEEILKCGGRLCVQHLHEQAYALGLLEDGFHLARLVRKPRCKSLERVVAPSLLREQFKVEASTRVLPELRARALGGARNVAEHGQGHVLEMRGAHDGLLQVRDDALGRRTHHRLLLAQAVELAEVVEREKHLAAHLEGVGRVVRDRVEEVDERHHRARALEVEDVS
mmetsp:Transcript_412/g.1063  ORF Transcript_412/g.1063 Transcript_412/m.1063 type:complete len:218 (-) Transcript_412:222-875(-)